MLVPAAASTRAERIRPDLARRAHLIPRSSVSGEVGDVAVHDRAGRGSDDERGDTGGDRRRRREVDRLRSPAASKAEKGPDWMLTASPLRLKWTAVRAAPTVPEWSTARPDVAARVDAGDDEVRRGTERPETAGDHDQPRKSVHAEGLDALEAVLLDPVDVDPVTHRVERADAGTCSARLVQGCRHEHVVAGVEESASEMSEAGRRDAVVVRD